MHPFQAFLAKNRLLIACVHPVIRVKMDTTWSSRTAVLICSICSVCCLYLGEANYNIDNISIVKLVKECERVVYSHSNKLKGDLSLAGLLFS